MTARIEKRKELSCNNIVSLKSLYVNAFQIKQQLQDYIELADESFLHTMLEIAKNHFQSKEAVIAYSAQGQKLTQEEFNIRIENAERDINNGLGFSSEEIRQLKNK